MYGSMWERGPPIPELANRQGTGVVSLHNHFVVLGYVDEILVDGNLFCNVTKGAKVKATSG